MAGRSHRGPNQSVQRALGWVAREQAERVKEQAVACEDCGADMDFRVADPLGLVRSMQRCTNRDCPRHQIIPLERVI